MANYSFKTIGLPEPVNGVIEGHNFTQAAPHTAIYSGYSGLTFRNCNLTNCDVPEGSVIEDCLHPNHISFCSHVAQELFDSGRISQCVTECSHMTTKDVITIDGVIVDTNYTYANKVVA